MRTSWIEGRAARFRKEFAEHDAFMLRKALLLRITECALRLFLAAILSSGEILGGYAPFGLGFVGASGAGLPGFCSLLGACLGYFLMLPFSDALKYSAVCILIFSVSFAFYDVRLYRMKWFMPVVSGLLTGVIGIMYQSAAGWNLLSAAGFGTEVVLVACTTYFYRLAASARISAKNRGEPERRQMISLLIFCISLLIPLARVTPFAGLSVGRIAAALGVMMAAYRGGAGAGSAVGVAAGLALDLAAGGGAYYFSMLYGLSGSLSGAFFRQSRLVTAVVYVTGNAAAAFWAMKSGLESTILYEVFIASVLFLLLPERALQTTGQLFQRKQASVSGSRRLDFAKERLERTANAFRELYESLRGSFSERINDNDVATVYDRAAGRVCRNCALWTRCWQREYVSTFNALNDASSPMTEHGRAESSDFPTYFSSRCIQFPALLSAINEEYSASLSRRQYKNRLRENRAAVCRQYAELSDLLETTAAEFSAELRYDSELELRLQEYLQSKGVEAEGTVFLDGRGRLRAEISGRDLSVIKKEDMQSCLRRVLGVALRSPLTEEKEGCSRMIFRREEPLTATIGIAACRKEGESVSGDAGTYFKTEDSYLYVILSDGMGSGPGAAGESNLAVRLLERFLKAGVAPESALKTLNSALALRWEEEGGFTTIDLVRLDLFTGETGVYKYGAAPTYIRKGTQVNRITGTSLPAGLTVDEAPAPDRTQFRLEAGDLAILISDGITGTEEDNWLQTLVANWNGESPRALARTILAESRRLEAPKDDRTVLVLRLDHRRQNPAADPAEAGCSASSVRPGKQSRSERRKKAVRS